MHCISIINLGIFVQLIHWKFHDYIEFVFTICLNRNTIACLRLSSAILLSSLLSEKRANQYFYRHSSARKRHKKKGQSDWIMLYFYFVEKKKHIINMVVYMSTEQFECTVGYTFVLGLVINWTITKSGNITFLYHYKEKLQKIQP